MESQKILSKNEWKDIRKIANVHTAKLRYGGNVHLISPLAKLGPEFLAMLQALYSRDPSSILKHLLDVARTGPEKFMAKFYVGYGHKSIGDCGNILLAFEGVSVLAVKAIQDSKLYNGQEASTRYIDFSTQEFLFMGGDAQTQAAAKNIQEAWRTFYLNSRDKVVEFLKKKYPYEDFKSENSKTIWEKTLTARMFDILRGFLPAGVSTYCSLWTSLSHASEHLSWLRCHLLSEVRELASKTEKLLKNVYPASFSRTKHHDREVYKKFWYEEGYYERSSCHKRQATLTFDAKQELTSKYRNFILKRPKGVELPSQLAHWGTVTWTTVLDFASWRDIQRHRAVDMSMPLLVADAPFHNWYFDNLPPDLISAARELVSDQIALIKNLDLDVYQKQYLLPMGLSVPIHITGSISKIIYLLELRAQKPVHPTLHAIAYHAGRLLKIQLASYLQCDEKRIPLYIDSEVGYLTLKRGQQDIVRVE